MASRVILPSQCPSQLKYFGDETPKAMVPMGKFFEVRMAPGSSWDTLPSARLFH